MLRARYHADVGSSDATSSPTHAYSLFQELAKLEEVASSGVEIFFMFSGHGESVKDVSGDEEDGMDEGQCAPSSAQHAAHPRTRPALHRNRSWWLLRFVHCVFFCFSLSNFSVSIFSLRNKLGRYIYFIATSFLPTFVPSPPQLCPMRRVTSAPPCCRIVHVRRHSP